MSEYGPAFFIKRKDKQEMDEREQKYLLKLVVEIAKKSKLKDDEGKKVSPSFYSYHERSLAILMYTAYTWRHMPESIYNDQIQWVKRDCSVIRKEIDKKNPNTYTYDCSGVEN